MTNRELNPKWFIQGVTYLLPKSNEINIPKNHRPITCLPNMHKILTSIITEITYNFLITTTFYQQNRKDIREGHMAAKIGC